jgi:hypothetical protein
LCLSHSYILFLPPLFAPSFLIPFYPPCLPIPFPIITLDPPLLLLVLLSSVSHFSLSLFNPLSAIALPLTSKIVWR